MGKIRVTAEAADELLARAEAKGYKKGGHIERKMRFGTVISMGTRSRKTKTRRWTATYCEKVEPLFTLVQNSEHGG
jgi:hypothetical protein